MLSKAYIFIQMNILESLMNEKLYNTLKAIIENTENDINPEHVILAREAIESYEKEQDWWERVLDRKE